MKMAKQSNKSMVSFILYNKVYIS